jgi:hypothetical protein
VKLIAFFILIAAPVLSQVDFSHADRASHPSLVLESVMDPQHDQSFVAAVDEPIQFVAIDVIVDTGDVPLAVYQVDISPIGATEPGQVTIVGIEGGVHDAFAQPPHYDPEAIQSERIILGAFNTGNAQELPKGRVKVATLHVQNASRVKLKFKAKLEVCSTVDGKAISGKVILETKGTQK